MGKIIGIAAVSPEGVIAINDKMPWNVSEDLKHFKECTENNVVIMGRITWDTLNRKCLPNRINFVISEKGSFKLIEGTCAQVFTDVQKAITEAQLKYPLKKVFIIGGSSLYKQTLCLMDEFYLTIINKEEVLNAEGEVKYLKDYPTCLTNDFIEVNSHKGLYGTYKKYQRRVVTQVYKKRIFYS